MTEVKGFNPDWVSLPGDTILDVLEENGWTKEYLAELLGYTVEYVNQLINGEASIDEETALDLQRVLGGTAQFWLNLEALYSR